MVTKQQLAKILSNVGSNIDPDSIDYDATFTATGLDSLDIFNFFAEVDAEFGVAIPDADFEKIDTLNKLYDYMQKKNG